MRTLSRFRPKLRQANCYTERGRPYLGKARIVSLALLAVLPGCAVRERDTAAAARTQLIGLTEQEMKMCAGFPAKSESVKGETIWMYEHAAAMPALPEIALPLGGTLHAASGGYCRVQVRLARGRVAEVSYAGATDILGARDAACAPIVRSCLDYRAQRTAAARR